MTEYIQYFPVPFLEDLVQSRVLPVVGAGFSLNANIPTGKNMLDWDGLGKAVAASLPEYQYSSALEAISAYAHEFSRVKLVEFLTESLLITTIQPGKTHEEFCKLPFDRVVTTNFDFLLESGYARISRYCIPQIAEEQLSIGEAQAGVRLLKLHGDLHHPNRLVATEEDYDSFLTDYPLLATHLSSLLIDHTALLIGYSLDDPDFRQIWHVVKNRLGSLRRPAYVLQVGAPSHSVARYERRGVKVINLPKSRNRSYPEVLNIVFQELREYWSNQVVSRSTASDTDQQVELALPVGSTSRIMFFSVPTKLSAFYKERIYPIAERFGFSPLMASDVVSPGDNIMAKVYALLDKSAVIFADISSPNTIFEVGMAQSQREGPKTLIVAANAEYVVPIDISNSHVIIKPLNFPEESELFADEVERTFNLIFSDISSSFEEEPKRLLAKKEWSAAVLASFSLLEHEMREYILTNSGENYYRHSFRRLLEYFGKNDLLSIDEVERLIGYSKIRNSIAHTKERVSAKIARNIVKDIEKFLEKFRAQG